MNISFIGLYNFRNYKSLKLNTGPKINIIYGKNASGKTNLLEAIYMTCKAYSFKNPRDNDLINFSKNEACILGTYENNCYKDNYRIEITRNNVKKYFINEQKTNSKDFRQARHIILFSPVDLNIIKNSPSDRRRFIDESLSNIDLSYDYYLSQYRKILMERNKLLKISKNMSLLEIYDRELSKIGSKIIIMRLIAIKELNKYANKHYQNLSKNDRLKTTYLSTIPLSSNEEEIRENFYNFLKLNQYKDFQRKNTSIGPHRDDIDFKINDKSTKAFGSQGEQRSVVLSLKLSEFDLIYKKFNDKSILLLDDVFSELDEKRTMYLLDSIKYTQTFITTTEFKDYFKNLNISSYNIEDINKE